MHSKSVSLSLLLERIKRTNMGVVLITHIHVLSTCIFLSVMSKCDAQITGTSLREYQKADTFCYKFYYNNRSTWNQADARCKQDGALLIKLESFTMLRNVKSIIQTKELGPIDVWVGARNYSSGYVWTDGTRVSSDLWSEGEPNDQNGDEDCAEVDHMTDTYLNDAPCDFKQAFICQGLTFIQTTLVQDVEQSDPTAPSFLTDMHSTSRQKTHGNTNIFLIAASVSSVVVGLLAVALVVYICVMRRKQRPQDTENNTIVTSPSSLRSDEYDTISPQLQETHDYEGLQMKTRTYYND
ncbi:C-type lectin galactose-binding isoform-like isoform X1 [Dreissena polymorpha]|uniref:C-type lectin galactose-binding isoform-like isoform X1 n=1 Tax=Dreissena polymorpha TaxID=45954 RepID=UPI002264B664|nr:C-type lectin galactose-binding isoform-like isoform X1 [Dreissena polymorpha]